MIRLIILEVLRTVIFISVCSSYYQAQLCVWVFLGVARGLGWTINDEKVRIGQRLKILGHVYDTRKDSCEFTIMMELVLLISFTGNKFSIVTSSVGRSDCVKTGVALLSGHCWIL